MTQYKFTNQFTCISFRDPILAIALREASEWLLVNKDIILDISVKYNCETSEWEVSLYYV